MKEGRILRPSPGTSSQADLHLRRRILMLTKVPTSGRQLERKVLCWWTGWEEEEGTSSSSSRLHSFAWVY